MPTFTTTLLQQGNNVGIVVPDEVVASLGAGKRAPVTISLNGYTYRNTLAVMGGRSLVGVNAEHRKASGVAGGETHEVTIELDSAPRTVEVPADLVAALDAAGVRQAFDALAYSHRKEHVRAIEEAKAAATRERRIAACVAKLGG